MATFIDMLLLVGFLVITLAILVPLAGALVRLRAHYIPKNLQLEPEGDVQLHTGPVITSFFAMLVRVYRIEGWPGLYRGLMPTLLLISVVTLFLWIFVGYDSLRHGIYAPSTDILGILAYSLFAMLVFLPQKVITDRTITTPHKLPYFNPIFSLRILLTPTERWCPWILYLTPGLLAAHVSQTAYAVLGLRTVRQWLLPEHAQLSLPFEEGVSTVRLAIFFVLAAASTVILTPLEVIAVRLAIQRNHAVPEFNSVSQEEEEDTVEETAGYAGIDEDVIGYVLKV
ncbi:mitochondrial carrier [Lanmaoa asiatica]|nr:mitochondrial carrier [Lanmaoa asiatica]